MDDAEERQRILPVWIDDKLVADGQLRQFSVGEDVSLRLTFAEATEGDGPGAVDLDALARPGARWLTPDGEPRWNTALVGDGWTARWKAPRRVDGRARLTGRLWALLDPFNWDHDEPTEGRVWRILAHHREVVVDPARPARPEFAPGPGRWSEVDRCPAHCAHPLAGGVGEKQAVSVIAELLVSAARPGVPWTASPGHPRSEARDRAHDRSD